MRNLAVQLRVPAILDSRHMPGYMAIGHSPSTEIPAWQTKKTFLSTSRPYGTDRWLKSWMRFSPVIKSVCLGWMFQHNYTTFSRLLRSAITLLTAETIVPDLIIDLESTAFTWNMFADPARLFVALVTSYDS